MSGYMININTGDRVFMVKDEIKLIRRCKNQINCDGCPYDCFECEDFIESYGSPIFWIEEED